MTAYKVGEPHSRVSNPTLMDGNSLEKQAGNHDEPKSPKALPASDHNDEAKDPYYVPDGGYQAWLTLAGAFFVVFTSSGYTNSFGVFEDYYVREFLSESSSSQISWIGGVQTFCLFSAGIIGGYAMDIGYFRHMMAFGSILFVFCLFMVSITSPQHWYQLFLAQGVGLGIAVGATYVPALGVVSHHFKRYRSLAMGIVAAGSSLGGVIHPIMLNMFFNGRVGFYWGVRISAFFNMGLLVIANAIMSTRLPPQNKELKAQIKYWKGFFKDRAYLAATAGMFFLVIGQSFPIFFLQLISVQRGLGGVLAFYTIVILNGTSFFGRIVPTIFTNRFGVFNMIVPCTLICGILIFAMQGVTTAAGIVVMSILFGFFSGACISLLGPMLAELASSPAEIGARIGVCFSFGGLGSLIGPPISGALLTSRFLWIQPIVFNGVAMCLGALSFAIARQLKRTQATK